jgi:hypothetical protein
LQIDCANETFFAKMVLFNNKTAPGPGPGGRAGLPVIQ